MNLLDPYCFQRKTKKIFIIQKPKYKTLKRISNEQNYSSDRVDETKQRWFGKKVYRSDKQRMEGR